MVTVVYLIRHGETEGDADGVKRYKGSLDVPMSAHGEQQIEGSAGLIKVLLGPEELSAVYCSGLIRAKKSAEIIGAKFDLTPKVVPELMERNFGRWEGMSFEEIEEAYPEDFRRWAGNPLEFSPPGGETTLEVSARALKAFEQVTKGHVGQAIAVVAHGGVNRAILCHVLGVPLENLFRVEQDHAGVNVIEIYDDYPLVRLMNARA